MEVVQLVLEKFRMCVGDGSTSSDRYDFALVLKGLNGYSCRVCSIINVTRVPHLRRIQSQKTTNTAYFHTNRDMSSHSEDLEVDEPPTVEPYQVLGIEKTATADQVKSAYRKAALKWHPGNDFIVTSATPEH